MARREFTMRVLAEKNSSIGLVLVW
jgi:hypothetical protein